MGRWTRGWKHNVAAGAEWKHNLAIRMRAQDDDMPATSWLFSGGVSPAPFCATTVDTLHPHLTGGAVGRDDYRAKPGACPCRGGKDMGEVTRWGRVIALANQKGGVAKTTTALNLGAALAERGRRVLVVDLDQQGSLTMSAGLEPDELDETIYTVLSATPTRRRSALGRCPRRSPTETDGWTLRQPTSNWPPWTWSSRAPTAASTSCARAGPCAGRTTTSCWTARPRWV